MNVKKIPIYISEYLMIFAMLFKNLSVIGTHSNIKIILSIMFFIGLSIISINSIINLLKYKSILKRLILIIMTIQIYNCIFIFFNKTGSKNYIIDFMIILPLLIIISMNYRLANKIDKFLIKLGNIVFIIAVVSLIFYFIGSLLGMINANGVQELNWGVSDRIRYVPSYYNLHYDVQDTIINGIRINRNSSIYAEATLFCVFLNLAICIELFINDKFSIVRRTIFIITIITTFSTTGIILMICIIIIKVISTSYESKYMKYIKKMITPLIIVISIIMIFMLINSKINADKNFGVKSYSVRVDDFNMGIYAWKSNKIFGAGYKNVEYFRSLLSSNIRGEDLGGSLGIMHVIYQGGIYLTVIHIVPLVFIWLNYFKKRKINILIVFSIMFLQLILNPIQYLYITFFILALGITYYEKKLD